MHIPDGVLSPSTSAVTTVAMLPVWTIAARRVRSDMGMRQIPLLSLGAAFCFTVMMFNIPALGGTTAHPVAGTLLAVLLGPCAAVIGISVALGIQALFFGDGGLLAFGANCFTMAFALPFVGYTVYRLLSGRSAAARLPRALAGAIGAYVGLNVAATLVGVFLGIQPTLFRAPNGHALYFPFGLNITLPAMLGTHLLIAGPAEAVVTALVVKYLQAAGMTLYGEKKEEEKSTIHNPQSAIKPLLTLNSQLSTKESSTRPAPLLAGLLVLVALTPLGLLAKGEAWGEWDASGVREQIKQVQGKDYVPQGIAQAEEHGYKGVRGLQDYASDRGKVAYAGAGLLGVGAIAGLLFLGGRLLAKPDRADSTPDDRDDDHKPGGNTPARETRRQGDKEREDPSIHNPQSTIHNPNTHSLPDWLQSANAAPEEPNLEGPRPNPFLERTLSGLANSAQTSLLSERWARQSGYLQQLDPRAKVAGFLLLIAVVTGLHRLPILLLLYGFALLLGLWSRLPLSLLFKRVWLSVPVFVGALALPATLNVVTPGRVLLPLSAHPFLAVTAPGLLAAATLTLRVGVAVTFALLLTLTTRWNDLLRALRILFVPRLFVLVLAMTYRYLIVLMQSAGDMFIARRSRTVGRVSHASARGFVGGSMGALFGKTLALSEEVHDAMLARGFNGDMRSLVPLRWRPTDSAWTGAMLLIGLLCLFANRG